MNGSPFPFAQRRSLRRHPLVALFLIFAWLSQQGAPLAACPFCNATSQTLSEEIAASDLVVLADLVRASSSEDLGSVDLEDGADSGDGTGLAESAQLGADAGMATFRILETLQGSEYLGGREELEVVYFGDGSSKGSWLITGMAAGVGLGAVTGTTGEGGASVPAASAVGKAPVDWSTPLPLSQAATVYVRRLAASPANGSGSPANGSGSPANEPGLPEKGPGRYAFFMEYFEHDDPLLAQDAYDEFARAPYAEIIALADQIDRARLMTWINDPQIGPTRRRLYLTMLGVCGREEDIESLERLLRYDYRQMKPAVVALVLMAGAGGSAIGLPILDELVRAEERRRKQCLDALVACYLKLKGPDGLELVEEKFLSNRAADYTHVYATIMALRFHGEETDAIPRERLLGSLRLVLDNREIADQVIPDLARWEDWEVMGRLVSMFETSEEEDWIRQPVVSYLIVAAEQSGSVGERATQALEKLEELDPQTVQRARSLMAFSGFGRVKPTADGDGADRNEEVSATEVEPGADIQTVGEHTFEEPPVSDSGLDAVVPPSRLVIIGVPILAGLILLAIFAVLLRGGDFRPPNTNNNNNRGSGLDF